MAAEHVRVLTCEWLLRRAHRSPARSQTFDVVVAFEERVFDSIVEDLAARGGRTLQPVLVLNLDVRDNAAEAGIAAPLALALCQSLAAAAAAGGWEGHLERILRAFEEREGRRPLYAVGFY